MPQTQITQAVDLTNAGDLYGPIRVDVYDDLYYRFERTEGSSTLTGVLEIGKALGTLDEPHSWADLTMTGTAISTVDVSDAAFVWLRVKTAQAGYKGIVHGYLRQASTIGGGGA